MEGQLPPHFHKFDRISEEDIVPDGRIYDELPESAEEGRWAVRNNGGTFEFYRFVDGGWRQVTGSSVTLPIDQSDVVDLVADLAAKADASHTHPASDIVSGVIDQDRLGSGSGGAGLKVLKDDQTWGTFPSLVTDRLEATVTPVGSFAVGDLLVEIPAATGAIVLRFEDASGMTSSVFGADAVEERAASFIAPYDFELTSIPVHLSKNGSPTDNVICRLYSDSGGSPGAQLELSSTAVAGGSIASPGFHSFAFSTALTGGTKYWVVMDRDGANDNTDNYNVLANSGWTDGSVASIFPGAAMKVSSDPLATWGSSGGTFRMEIKGDIAGGHYKWLGYRTSRLVFPYGIVTAVNGADADVVIGGLATGLSGLTPGTRVVNYCKVGVALSATELLVWLRKPFVITADLLGNGGLLHTVSGGGGSDVFVPLGFVPGDFSPSGTMDFAGAEEGEIRDSKSGTGTNTMRFSDEYEAI